VLSPSSSRIQLRGRPAESRALRVATRWPLRANLDTTGHPEVLGSYTGSSGGVWAIIGVFRPRSLLPL
jgi:hypothetical protein